MIYIVVRQTTDWQNEAAVQAQLPEGFKDAVALWNATFKLPYHVFRQELTRIARINWSRIAGATCIPRPDVPAGASVVPTDDDDWFAPELATVLEAAIDGDHVGYDWPSAFIELPISLGHRLGLIRRRLFPRTPPKWLCTTNNYAITMGSESESLVDSHVRASRWFVANPGRVKRLGDHLSVMNRTLASQTSFRSIGSQADLVRKYGRYRDVYRRPPAPGLAWSEPYLAMMRDLMDGLQRRT